MDDADAHLRHRLFLARLNRQLAHLRVVRESGVTRRLHAELHEVEAQSARLRRRASWLISTKKALPRIVR